MEYLLSKLLPLFVYPLGLTILLCLFGMMLVLLRRQWKGMVLILFSVAVLWVSATNVFSGYVVSLLEQDYPFVPIQQQPEMDAIVVLGGFTGIVDSRQKLIGLGDGIDRLFHGMRLFRAGKAPRIMLVGGASRGDQHEAQVMADMLTEFGISRDSMLIEDASRNTYENGRNAVAIMRENKIHRVLLVTSAFHMRRAQGVFEKLGVDVVPAATDYQVLEQGNSILDWLPDAGALMRTTMGMKEYLGLWVYRFREWVD